MPRSCTADDVFRALRKHDKGFEIHERRGKGSHRMIFHRPSGQQFPVPYHKGRDLGKTLPQGHYPAFQFAGGFLRLISCR
jgi:predicted RNA binding protein YcfA (HicA-like mRNA interferase family)